MERLRGSPNPKQAPALDEILGKPSPVGASGFVETVLADPIELIGRRELSDDERTRLLAASATSEMRERE